MHAKLSPSAAHRWLNCPGSVNLCKDIPRVAQDYTHKGTVAHELAAVCLIRNENTKEYIGYWGWVNEKGGSGLQKTEPGQSVIYKRQIDEETALNVQIYLDTVRKERAQTGYGIFLVEEKLDASWIAPGVWGTGDSVITDPLNRIVVTDYKNGFTPVTVEENPQLMIYGLGALGKDNPNMVETVKLQIVQPNGAPQVKEWAISVEELLTWGNDVLRPGVVATTKSDAILKTGDWCKWCPAKQANKCSELSRTSIETMFGSSVDIINEPIPNPPNPIDMTAVKIDTILQVADIMEDWLKAVREEAYRRLEQGSPDAPKNWKLVQGKLSNRAWKDENLVKMALGKQFDIMLPLRVKSPAQIEKTLAAAGYKPKQRKELVDPLLKERKPGKPIMVPVTDNRPALPPAADQMFN